MAVRFPAGIFLFAMLVFPMGTAHAESEAARDYYAQAQEAGTQGQWPEAAIFLRNTLKTSPDYFTARLALARTYHKLGDLRAAEKEAQIAHDALASDESAIVYGEVSIGLGKFAQAFDALGAPAATREAGIEKGTLAGFALTGLQRPEAAHEAFDKVLASEPDHVRARYGKAALLALEGRNRQAHTLLRAVTKDQADFTIAWNLRAETALALGENDDAIASMDKAVSLAPESAGSLVTRARVNLATGDIARARQDAEKAVRLSPNNGAARYILAAVSYAQGDIAQANDAFSTASTLIRNYAPLTLLGALIKLDREEFQQADQLFSKYLALNPDHVHARRALASLRLRAGQPQSAIRLLERAIRKNPGDVPSMEILASAYIAADRYSEAERTYRTILQSAPFVPAQKANNALRLLGASAAQATERLNGQDVASGRALLKILNHVSANNLAAAQSEVDALLRVQPENPLVINVKGGVELAFQRHESARKWFEKALEKDPRFLAAIDNLDRLDYLDERPEAVEARARDLAQTNPQSDGLAVRYANHLVRSGRLADAISYLAKRQTDLPDSFPLASALTRLYLSDNQPGKAAGLARNIAQRHAENASALAFAANALRRAGAHEASHTLAEKIASLNPDSAQAQRMLAQSWLFWNRTDEAKTTLRRALERQPANRALAQGLLELFLRERNYKDASALAAQFRKADPAGGALLQAEIHSAHGEHSRAVAALESAMNDAPNSEVAINLYRARKLAGENEKALLGLKSWLDKERRDAPALMIYAAALQERGDRIAAERSWSAYLALNPNDAVALNNYAWLRHDLGRHDAIDYAVRAYRIAPGTPQITDTLGWLMVQRGRLNEGLQILRVASRSAPDNGEVAYHFAFALEKAGAKDEARTVLEKALSAGGDFASREAAVSLLRKL